MQCKATISDAVKNVLGVYEMFYVTVVQFYLVLFKLISNAVTHAFTCLVPMHLRKIFIFFKMTLISDKHNIVPSFMLIQFCKRLQLYCLH